ncbi:MAG: hypothetical protein GX096_00750 [Clostridiales bacterium]|nr:hypothetical protein [Clostridiales bacterium]
MHTDECQITVEELICILIEEPHVHTDQCYQSQQTLICSQVPQEHYHDEQCLEFVLVCQVEKRQHGEGCFKSINTTNTALPTPTEDPTLSVTDTLEPTETLTDEPIETSTEEPTETPTGEPTEEPSEELTEDPLSLLVSDPNADLEHASQWEQTINKVKSSDVLGKDLVAIAETQIGCHESTLNFEVILEGTRAG